MKKALLLFLVSVLLQHLCMAQCTAVSITTQPTNQNDSIPGAAHFNVAVTGTAPYNYYWYVNGVVVDSTINSASATNTYNTPPLTMADSNNTYYCVITNCSGVNSITSNTVHLLCIPVSISIQPLSQTFVAGNVDTISFSVTVNGTPPFTYHWYRNPSTLVKTTIDTVGHTSIYTFYANPVTFSMNGSYHVVITNHCSGGGGGGSGVTSANAVLTVTCPTMAAPQISGTSQVCGEGNAYLSTTAIFGATYNWTGGFFPNGSTTPNYSAGCNGNPFNCTPTPTYFSVTITNYGCTSPPGYWQTYSYIPAFLNIPPADQTICSGGIVSFIPSVNCGSLSSINHSMSSCLTGFSSSGNYINDTLINTGTIPCSVVYTIYLQSPYPCFGYNYPITFTVTVNPESNLTVNSPTICSGQTATLTANGASTYTWSAGATSTGVNTATVSPTADTSYTVVGTNSCGTDTATATVTVINAIDNTVSSAGPLLTANQAGVAYQWLNCETGFSSITGATNQSYTITTNGQYAVVVSLGNCIDTSACVPFYSVGINELTIDNGEFTISPNPFTSQTTVTFNKEQKNTTIKIVDVLGQCIQQLTTNNKQLTLDMSGYPKGIYFVEVVNAVGQEQRAKIVLQ